MLENTGTITGNVFIGTSGAFVTNAGVMGGELTLSFLSDVCFAAGNGLVAGII
ncbi:hypothetical protein [Ascidiaceihabitans donghaensis]|uniref:hypothetical protein n=1 Tax=Ascidiaceihabitans donghaensis TaxID=1510460 RepID=UPI0015E80FA9|nr:hypothetical protein [Ascidiaceihabitans donghaensis]